MNNQVEYYRNSRVRRAIHDFMEGCEYIVGFGEAEVWKGAPVPHYSVPAALPHLEKMLEAGLDVFTSLWRTDSTVGVIDIEYFNHRHKGRAITDPGYAMWALRPLMQEFLREFAHYGLPFLALVTGQGVQLLFKVPFDDPVHQRLEGLGRVVERSVIEHYERVQSDKRARPVPLNALAGSKGMFRCELKLCNDVLKAMQTRRDAGEQLMPVVYSDIHLGDPEHGLAGQGPEGISLDLTCFGDPLHMRDHRAPFSTHQKQRADARYLEAYWTPLKVTLPFWSIDQFDEIARVRMEEINAGKTNFAFAAALANEVNTRIPTASWALDKVMDDIDHSPLGAFFAWFDSAEHDDEALWPQTYHNPGLLGRLPPCIRHSLEHPEPHLLRPVNLQRLVRVLDAMGWHPKHIGGLIYSRYTQLEWGRYNPEKRANYWAEQYAAPIHDGADDKRFMSCVEEQLRGFCIRPFCGWDLSWCR